MSKTSAKRLAKTLAKKGSRKRAIFAFQGIHERS